MNGKFNRHCPGGAWEEYALGMLSEEACKSLEEHLLICSKCQDLLARADEYIRVAKAALALLGSQIGRDQSLVTDFAQ